MFTAVDKLDPAGFLEYSYNRYPQNIQTPTE